MNTTLLTGEAFAHVLVTWQARHGRQHLPWQHTGDAYRVWLSEVMLQQTQVSTVLAYYARFLETFPTVADLAAASEETVMHLWAGLGYYSRARNLHACAKQVVERFGGQFPRTVSELASLPGIGRSTAGAIASLAHGLQAPILDGNVKRVFCRYYGVEGNPEQSAVQKHLWNIASANVPVERAGQYNQALMDLGATCCTPKKPNCKACPLMQSCEALRKGMVDLLPSPKPKKPRPNLYFVALLLRSPTGGLGMRMQTDKGVWFKLWTPPLLACEPAVDIGTLHAACDVWQQAFALNAHQLAQLKAQCEPLLTQPWLVHELTHRKMHFRVLALDLMDQEVPSGLEIALPKDRPVPKIVHKLLAHAVGLATSNNHGAVPKQHTLNLGQR
ncbi:MAG TPA: A/G-specific adenine glycosylase [Limnobacter sp.]|nr:A/G-specific adenine glycosylase [Limnobacter sp.]